MSEVVEIERMSYGAHGVAHRKDGKTVLVKGAVTGDVALIDITREKPNLAWAEAIKIVDPSPMRAQNLPCELCDECGGCPWAHLDYKAQLLAKRENIVEALVRTGGIERKEAEAKVGDCVPSKHEWGYRNKIELVAFRGENGGSDNRLSLGMHVQGGENLVAVESCPLANRILEGAPKAICGALRFLDGRSSASSRTSMEVFRVGTRASLRTKSVEIALWTPPSSFPRAHAAKVLGDAFKSTSIVRVLGAQGKARKVSKVEVLYGDGFWCEELRFDAGVKASQAVSYTVSAPSFFQVNTNQAERLVQQVLNVLSPLSGQKIADLYSGVGTFSIPLAAQGAQVKSIELAGSAVRDARRNAKHARVEIEAFCEDAARAFPKLGALDALVVDPPRAGLSQKVVGQIAAVHPERIVYISCDPQTLARDVQELSDCGYSLLAATPIDLFPQTYHVECVVLMTGKTVS